MMPGYKSDRGRVYLAYGDPNSRQQEYFPRSFDPFEVWHYHHIGTERNLRFVFMDNDRFNDYKLIYSNKQGEINDVYWMNRFQDEKNKENDRDLHSPFDYFETPQ